MHHALSKHVRSLNVCKKRFGTSPERHRLTAMPYRLFQGNLNPKSRGVTKWRFHKS